MAKPKKRPELTHCKVAAWSHPRTPWRVWFSADDEGRKVRMSKAFADVEAAWTWAEAKDKEIKNHGVRFGDLPAEARRAYDAFRDLRAEMTEAGFPVPDYGDMVAEAIRKVRESSTFSAVLRDVADQFIEAKKAERKATRHQDNLRKNLDRFCERYGKNRIASVSTADVDRYLAGLKSPKGKAAGPVTRAHHLVTLRTMWRWALKRGLAPADVTAPIARPKAAAKPPQCYTPKDTAEIFKVASKDRPELLPALALVFFAGLRPSEVLAVNLDDVDLKGRHLRVNSGKTGMRLAHLSKPACAWIASQPRRKGPVWVGSRRAYHEALREVMTTAGVAVIHDGGRHSFISYRTAATRNPALVADECGNSVQIIRKHYREIVSPDLAKAFFAILPAKGPAKVVSISA